MSSQGTAALAPLEPRVIAERYRIESLLGRGGMGTVYAAFDPVTDKRVALKLLSHAANDGALEPFEREYHTLASLKHPRIVEVYEYGQCEQGSFYTMELLLGEDLSTRAPMPWREVCACLRDVASVVALLHVRGLVHRDLSPRNVWRTPDGRLKLIDFGALAPFGPTSKLMGTPPLVPPEALRGLPLDARSDLYSLGALGYWLLSSVHAYPAKSVGELHAFWTNEPASVRNLASLVAKPGDDPVPAALEELIMELLRLDPERRVRSTAELIDRVSAIAELAPDSGDQAAQGYLQSKAFVGRERERERLVELLSDAERGAPRSLMVEAASGLGRSRLLTEMAIVTRVAGATTLSIDARGLAGPYAVARALLQRLIATLPEARRAAEARAEILGQLLPELSKSAVRPASGTVAADYSSTRVRLQTALQEWLLEVAKQRTLALFIDDLQAVDQESQSFLALIARAEAGHRVLLVSSILREGSNELSPLAQSLRSVSVSLRLLPMTRAELLALLRSVFGQAPYLERLAERLFRISEGNPGHCLELCEHLVRGGAARYVDGLWVLPTELSTAELPKSRGEGMIARLAPLDVAARGLAEALSVRHVAPLPEAVCRALAAGDAAQSSRLLARLLEAGVLIGSPAGYDFAHELLRERLSSELSAERRSTAHASLGEALLAHAGEHRLMRLAAGLHLIEAGQHERGRRLQVDAINARLEHGALDGLQRDVPLIERGYQLLREAGRDPYALATHLTMLACCGFQVDRRLATRYGEPALMALSALLKLELARRLQSWAGGKLGLVLALIAAGIGFAWRRDPALNLQQAIRYLFFAAASLSGTAAACLDGAAIRRYTRLVEPLAALGPDHAAGFMHEYLQCLVQRMYDRPALTIARGDRLLSRLRSGAPIRGLSDEVRPAFIAGLLFSQGITYSWRDGPFALEVAEQLEGFTPFYRMCADHLRSVFYAGQGQLDEAGRYRARVERQAIQLGTAWQLETWIPADGLKIAQSLHDALALKRAVQELERAAEELPAFQPYLRAARASYLLMRGKPREAIPLLLDDTEALSQVGWTRARGRLASAYNALGEHEQARAVCEDALARHSPDDLMFAPMNLIVEQELCIAEAGLGQFEQARQRLDALLAKHAPWRGPLTLGALHDTYVQVALRERDFVACGEHLRLLDEQYRPLLLPSLNARLDALSRQVQAAERGVGTDHAGVLLNDDAHLITRVQLMLSHSGELASERADRGLQIAVELSGADDGFIVRQQLAGEVVACLDAAPDPELVEWARARLLAAYASDETAAVENVHSLIDLNLKLIEGVRYCVAPLWARVGHADVVVAAVALGFRNSAPKLPSADVLRVIASSLIDVQRTQSTDADAH